jgi:hypothetical protein
MRLAPLVAIVAAALLASCATEDVAGTEQMLAASGFAIEPATTPERMNRLAMLPPHKLMQQPSAKSAPTYVYADPDRCHCLYVGGPANYQYFQHLAVQHQIADEQLQAAQLNANAALNWMIPPPPQVIIVHHR